VYLARQLEPIRRRVALKVIKLGVGSGGPREHAARLSRFDFERQALAMMNHPHIARVYEAGSTSDGRLYFGLEYVPGLPITEYCDRTRMSVRERLDLFVDVCRAVHHAHQKGIIHRDIKPSNVLVSDEGGTPSPKIIDFGVARAIDFRLTEHTFVTQLGVVVGSLRYMSPEQADGRNGDVDTRTDIYSLGVLLYELLVGATPLDDRNIDELGYAALQRRIQEEEPRRPSARVGDPEGVAAAELRATGQMHLIRELRGEIDWIVLKALEKERLRRYASASEFADDIERFLRCEPVTAGPPGARYRLRKFIRRHRVPVAATFAVAIALVAGFAATSTLYLENRRAARIAREQRDEILRLSDAKRLATCIEEAERLYPPHPDMVPRMHSWLEGAAAELAARLPRHRATLGRLEEEGADVAAVDPKWDFHHDLLSELVADLECFVDPDPAVGTMASVRQRLAFAETVYERTIASRRAEWADAIRSIADRRECPRYGGMVIAPQVGLVPLGRDPGSGLWEFGHVQSGVPPVRDAGGNLKITTESSLVMVLVPGGRFWMGSDSLRWDNPQVDSGDPDSRFDERPPHQIRLDPFFVSKYEMTRAQWARITAVDLESTPIPVRTMDPDGIHPVTGVDWARARRIARRMGMDLPTEAQWEYAARGGTALPYMCGADPACLNGFANLVDQTAKESGSPLGWIFASWHDGYVTTAPVGAFSPNRFGLHDVIGNVWEWCRDLYAPYDNPVTPGDGERAPGTSPERMARGAGFNTAPGRARVSWRGDLPATNTERLGLRPVRRLTPSTEVTARSN
jgi:formylglycine-generating enzyme required for sulfatase activity